MCNTYYQNETPKVESRTEKHWHTSPKTRLLRYEVVADSMLNSVLCAPRHNRLIGNYYLVAETSSVSSVFVARGYLRSNAQNQHPFHHLPCAESCDDAVALVPALSAQSCFCIPRYERVVWKYLQWLVRRKSVGENVSNSMALRWGYCYQICDVVGLWGAKDEITDLNTGFQWF